MPVFRVPLVACLVAGTVALGGPAMAATIDASAEVVSDYRFRGVSLSDRQPVIEASAEGTAGPWFAGAEVISASRPRSLDQTSTVDAEVDVSAGWSRSLGLLTPTAGVIGYLRPGGGAATGEVFASLGGALGPATLTAGGNYAPAQAGARGGNLYVFTRAAAGVPGTRLTVRASAGREAGALAGGRTKLDWSAGVEARVVRVVTLGLAYVGNDLPTTGPGRVQRNRENGFSVRASVRF